MDIKLGEKFNGKCMVDPLPLDDANEIGNNNMAMNEDTKVEDVRHPTDHGAASMDAGMEEFVTTHEHPYGVCDNAPTKIYTLFWDPMLQVDEDTHQPYEKR